MSLPPALQRKLGAYMTPGPLARLMASLLGSTALGGAVLDPAAGTGNLLRAIAAERASRRDLAASSGPLLGVEVHPDLAAHADAEAPAGVRLVTADALELLDPERRLALLGRAELDAVIANPPYVREKDHRAVFHAITTRFPQWRRYRAPRGDLQQLFLILAAELLAPAGELVFLMNPYWLTTDSGRVVRDHLAERLDLLSLVDFGAHTLFDDAPGQHNLLLHARRKGTTVLSEARFVRVSERAPRELPALTEGLGAALRGGRAPAWLDVATGPGPVAAGPRRRWYLPSSRDGALRDLERDSVPLGELYETHQGVVSGADRVTARNIRHLHDPAPPLGTGIFVLSAREVAALGLSAAEQRVVRGVYRARDVQRFELPALPGLFVLYLHDGVDFASLPAIERHLTPFRPLLERRREVVRGLMPWWRLHWPRTPGLFDRPRLVTPRRSDVPRFALGLPGHCEQSDLALVTDTADDVARLRALAAVLNSGVITAWCRSRGKQKGAIREFFGRALEELPLPAAARDDPPGFLALAEYASPERSAAAEPFVLELYGEPARRLLEQ